jgi:hypothetical protein
MFLKFLEIYSRALKYFLLVHRNLVEGSSGHLKILLESVKWGFEEISNKYHFSNIFST